MGPYPQSYMDGLIQSLDNQHFNPNGTAFALQKELNILHMRLDNLEKRVAQLTDAIIALTNNQVAQQVAEPLHPATNSSFVLKI
jgi:hypothetical protein